MSMADPPSPVLRPVSTQCLCPKDERGDHGDQLSIHTTQHNRKGWETWMKIILRKESFLKGFPSGSHGKESACNAGDLGSIPGLGRSRGGNSNPLQYSCLENPHGKRSLAGYSLWGCRVGHDWVTKHISSLFLNWKFWVISTWGWHILFASIIDMSDAHSSPFWHLVFCFSLF